MLETDDHGITLVFESRLTIGERRPAVLQFPFSWPASLVDAATRSCRGKVKMTLIYEPPIDPAFGTEFVRVNLDALLQQRQPIDRKDRTPSWRNQIKQVFLPKTNGITPPERALIDHGLKWWPTKATSEQKRNFRPKACRFRLFSRLRMTTNWRRYFRSFGAN